MVVAELELSGCVSEVETLNPESTWPELDDALAELPPRDISGLFVEAAEGSVLCGWTSPATTVAIRNTSSAGSLN